MIYYNEFDPKAAAWLRELIKAGHLPDGYVDERSIVDVKAEDLKGFTQCHFFAGIGGWPLALEMAGWPDDKPVWTGSCPCQPFSQANSWKRENDERDLWHVWEALIRVRCADPNGERWRPIEPGAQPLADGVPGRVGLLRGYGNAIVPQLAATFIQAVMEAA